MKAKIIDKKIVLKGQTICCGDKNAQTIVIEAPFAVDGVSLASLPVYVKTENALGQKCKTRLTSSASEDCLLIEWKLGAEATCVSGSLKCQIVFESSSGELVMHTKIFTLEVQSSVSENGPKAIPEYNHITQMQNELVKILELEPLKKGDAVSLLENDANYLTKEQAEELFASAEVMGISKIEKTKSEGLVDTYTIFYTNGSTTYFNVTNGEKGEKGDKGEQGIQGEKGEKGDKGEQGIQGENGEKGDKGEQGIQGEKGEKGDKGEQGIQGEKGEKGVSVHSIAAGESFQSADGAKTYTPIRVRLDDNVTEAVFNVEAVNGAGQKGEKGDKGDKGEQGVGISNVEAGDSFEQDGYTVTPINVTLSNNEGKLFYVEAKNGEQGIQGEQGEQGVGISKIEKTSTAGLVDTYTITYTDNTTSTFTVTNGANGSGSGSVVLPDNVAEYDGATSSGEIIVSDETSNKIKTSAIKIAKSRVTTANTGETTGDGMWGSNVRSTDEEMPTSRAVCEALRGTFDYFVAIGETQADRTEIAENEVVIGDPSFLMKAAVRGSQKFLTNDYDFRQEGKPIDDTHIPTTKVVKTIVDDAIATSGGSSGGSNTGTGGGGTIEEKLDDIITGRLPIQRLAVGRKITEGETETTEEVGAIEYNETNSQLDVKGEIIYIDSTREGEQGTDNAAITLSSGCVNIAADEQINITAREGGTTYFNGKVSFQGAEVIGLPKNSGSSGGTLANEVEELPTENIDSSRIYLLSTAENAEVYYLFEVGYFTLKDLVTIQMGIQPEINYYVVKELPTSPLTSDLATFSSINCYIYNDIAYVYGNAGAGNMWLTVSTLISQISGTTVIDKGRTPNIATENNGFGMYVYYEEVKKLCIYSNQEWVEVSNSKSNKYILNLFGESGTLTDEQYQALKDNFSNVTVLYCHEDGIFALPITVITQGYFAGSFVIGFTEYTITISPAKVWVVEQNNFKKGVVTTTGVEQTIESEKIFNSTVTFNATVDFTNANVTGLTGIKAKRKINLPTLQSFCKSTYDSYEGGLVSMYCKNAEVITPELNEVVSTVLRIGCSPLSNGAYEVYNKVTHNALSDDGTTLYIYEYLLRIGYDIVVLDKTTTAINLADGTSTKTTESFGHKVIDVYFDFYFYN